MPAQPPVSMGRLTLEARKKLTLNGATEVAHFDEELVELHTDLGTLIIEGRDLKLKCLSLDSGTVVVEGELDALRYEQPRLKRSLWR